MEHQGQKTSKREKEKANTNHPNKNQPPTPLESWTALSRYSQNQETPQT